MPEAGTSRDTPDVGIGYDMEDDFTYIELSLKWLCYGAILIAPIFASRPRHAFLPAFLLVLVLHVSYSWHYADEDIPPIAIPGTGLLIGSVAGGVSIFLFKLIQWLKLQLMFRGIIRHNDGKDN